MRHAHGSIPGWCSQLCDDQLTSIRGRISLVLATLWPIGQSFEIWLFTVSPIRVFVRTRRSAHRDRSEAVAVLGYPVHVRRRKVRGQQEGVALDAALQQ